MNNCQNGELQG